MNNIMKIVSSGSCTGCSACNFCAHISFVNNQYGFYSPVVDDKCTGCGECLEKCNYDPLREDSDD